MNTRKLYQEMAQIIDAIKNCEKSGNTEWFNNHTEYLEKYLLEKLPHGSGLDYTWRYDYQKSNANKIVLTMSYHAMNENGYYDRVIDFTLTITANLAHGFDTLITGNFGKYQDIKDYLYDILTDSLNQDIDINVGAYTNK
jgi:hypothetical protein